MLKFTGVKIAPIFFRVGLIRDFYITYIFKLNWSTVKR